MPGNPLSLGEAVEKVKVELELDPSLKGKAAVDAAKLALLSRGRMKEQVHLICCELGIETRWDEKNWNRDAAKELADLRAQKSALEKRVAELERGGATRGLVASPRKIVPKTPRTRSSSSAVPSKAVEELRMRGRAAARAGKYEQAAKIFADAIALAPQDAQLRLQRSQTTFKLGIYEEAMRDGAVYTQLKPQSSKGWDCLAQAHVQLANFSEAQTAFMKGLALDPRNAEMAKGYSRAAAMEKALAAKPKEMIKINQNAGTEQAPKPAIGTGYGPNDQVISVMAELSSYAPSTMATEVVTADAADAGGDIYSAAANNICCQRAYIVGSSGATLRPNIGSAPGASATAYLAPGTKVIGRGVRADASGDVHVEVDCVQYPLSQQMASCTGSFALELAKWKETARDFTRAFVAGSGDMLIMVEGKHAAPVPITSTVQGSGDVNEEVTQAAVNEFTQLLTDNSHPAVAQRSDAGRKELAQRVIANLTVTPSMDVLISNGMSPAVFQNKFVVLVGPSELRVASYGFVGDPAVGDRPDRKSTPFCLKILSANLLDGPASDGKQHGSYFVAPTAATQMDTIISADAGRFNSCLASCGLWETEFLGSSDRLGWLTSANWQWGGGGDDADSNLELIELFPVDMQQDTEKTSGTPSSPAASPRPTASPRRLPLKYQGERPLAALEDAKARTIRGTGLQNQASQGQGVGGMLGGIAQHALAAHAMAADAVGGGSGGDGSSHQGTLILTDQRLLWMPAHRDTESASLYYCGNAMAIPLCRVGWVSFQNTGSVSALSFTVAGGDLAEVGGAWHNLGAVTLRVERTSDKKGSAHAGQQASALAAFYWHLRRAVDQRLRLACGSGVFQPIVVAEQAMARSCEQALCSLRARDVCRQWNEIVKEAVAQNAAMGGMAEQLLATAREFVNEITKVLETEQNIECWRSNFMAVPAVLTSIGNSTVRQRQTAPIRKGFAKLLGRPGFAPMVVLVLTARRLEVYEEILLPANGADSDANGGQLAPVTMLRTRAGNAGATEAGTVTHAPFRRLSADLLVNIEEVAEWGGKTAGRSGMASATTLQVKMTSQPQHADGANLQPLVEPQFWFDAGSKERMIEWKEAIERAVCVAKEQVGEQGTGSVLDDEDESELDDDERRDELLSSIDKHVGWKVRQFAERAILGSCTAQLFDCADATAELSPEMVDEAMERCSRPSTGTSVDLSQAQEPFCIKEPYQDPTMWQAPVECLDAMQEWRTMLPVELSSHLLGCHTKIYDDFSLRQSCSGAVGPAVLEADEFDGIFLFVMCRSSSRKLAAGLEYIRRFATQTEEGAVIAVTAAAVQKLLRHDTNAQINAQIQTDMLTFIESSKADGKTPILGEWAKVSAWAHDTGGERDAEGVPIRAVDGVWLKLWIAAGGQAPSRVSLAEEGVPPTDVVHSLQ